MHDLAAYLAGRGHDVTILTSHRGRPSRSYEDGFEVVRGWRLPGRLHPRGAEPHVLHAPMALLSAGARDFDLVHSLHIPDGWALGAWARIRRRPLVLSLMGYPDAESLDAFRFRRAMLARAARGTRAVHVLSEAAAGALQDAAGIEAISIHPGVDTSAYRIEAPRASAPTLFCAANPADPRKRVGLLVEAFALLRERRPDARLRIDDGGRPGRGGVSRAPGVEVVDATASGLATEYATAWATVLPSAREAFGLVLVESLAAGTPAVGIAEGAVPEILSAPDAGVIADSATPQALAEAMHRALELGAAEGSRDACRRLAQRWDWSTVGERFESLYSHALGGQIPCYRPRREAGHNGPPGS
jgi:glycosyltransferase involved in cell wall biosynthesis